MPRALAAALLVLSVVPAFAGEKVLAEKPVRVVTSGDAEMFPESWRKAPISASAEVLAKEQEKRAVAVVERAAKKYPPALLKKYLKTVYVVSELRFRDISAGGTNSRDDVYLKLRDEKDGFTDEWAEGVFHAELSSILLREREKDFDTAAWVKFNPDKFKYLGDGVDAVKQNKADTTTSADLFDRGFLKEYSMASVEEDFNGFAALLLCGDKVVWAAADKHPKIAGKLKLTLAFYEKLDPTLTEKALRALAPK